MGDRKHRVIGYGTLLADASRAKTVSAASGLELVWVEGHRRDFNVRPDKYEPSHRLRTEPTECAAMNLVQDATRDVSAVSFQVDDDGLRALDLRERSYERRTVNALAFEDRAPLGEAYVYVCPASSHRYVTDPELLLPRWTDVFLALCGSSDLDPAFGEAFENTTFLADGRTPLMKLYEPHRDELREDYRAYLATHS